MSRCWMSSGDTPLSHTYGSCRLLSTGLPFTSAPAPHPPIINYTLTKVANLLVIAFWHYRRMSVAPKTTPASLCADRPSEDHTKSWCRYPLSILLGWVRAVAMNIR